MIQSRVSWSILNFWQKVFFSAAVCVALYAAFGFLLLPSIARYVLEEKVSQVLQRQVDVQEIRFNPFTLTSDIAGFSIKEKDVGTEFVAFDALHANLELSSCIGLRFFGHVFG